MFIVHGHDNEYLLQLKDYIQNTLRLGQPVVLREKASGGRTIIEKFERETKDVDIVFVLITPDDLTVAPTGEASRSRQNVVFELGFFYAKLQRTSGKIIVLKKGDVEIPSDVAGITYVDVSKGIGAAGDEIRSELQNLGWLHVE